MANNQLKEELVLSTQHFDRQIESVIDKVNQLRKTGSKVGSGFDLSLGKMIQRAVGFNGSIGSLVGTVGKFSGALGVAFGAGEVFTRMLSQSQTVGDGVARVQSQASEAVNYFATCLARADFSHFLSGLQNIISKAGEVADALDDLQSRELLFSGKMKQLQSQYNRLGDIARDPTRSTKERKEALEAQRKLNKEMAVYEHSIIKANKQAAYKNIRKELDKYTDGNLKVSDKTIDKLFDYSNYDRRNALGDAYINQYKDAQNKIAQAEKQRQQRQKKENQNYVGGNGRRIDYTDKERKDIAAANATLARLRKDVVGQLAYAAKEIDDSATSELKKSIDMLSRAADLEQQSADRTYQQNRTAKRIDTQDKPTKTTSTKATKTHTAIYKEDAKTVQEISDNVEVLNKRLKDCVPNSKEYNTITKEIAHWQQLLTAIGYEVVGVRIEGLDESATTIKGICENISLLEKAINGLDPSTEYFDGSIMEIKKWGDELQKAIDNVDFDASIMETKKWSGELQKAVGSTVGLKLEIDATAINDIIDNIETLQQHLKGTVKGSTEWLTITEKIKKETSRLGDAQRSVIGDLHAQLAEIQQTLSNEEISVTTIPKIERAKDIQKQLDNERFKANTRVNLLTKLEDIKQQLTNETIDIPTKVNLKNEQARIEKTLKDGNYTVFANVELLTKLSDIRKELTKSKIDIPTVVKIDDDIKAIEDEIKSGDYTIDTRVNLLTKLEDIKQQLTSETIDIQTRIKIDDELRKVETLINNTDFTIYTRLQLETKLSDINKQLGSEVIDIPTRARLELEKSEIERQLKGDDYTINAHVRLNERLKEINEQLTSKVIDIPTRISLQHEKADIEEKLSNYTYSVSAKVNLELEKAEIEKQLAIDGIDVETHLRMLERKEDIEKMLQGGNYTVGVQLQTEDVAKQLKVSDLKVKVVGIDEGATTIKGINDNITQLQQRLDTLDPSTVYFKSITEELNKWQEKLDRVNGIISNLNFKENATTIKAVNDNIAILQAKLNDTVKGSTEWHEITKKIKAETAKIADYQKGSIGELQAGLADIEQRLTNENLSIATRLELIDKKDDIQSQIDSLSDDAYIKVKTVSGDVGRKAKSVANSETNISTIKEQYDVGIIGYDEAKAQIDEINNELMKIGAKPIKVHLETELEQKWQNIEIDATSIVQGFEGIDNVISDISQLSQAISEGANGWQIFMGTLQSGIGILQSVGSVLQTLTTLQEIFGKSSIVAAAQSAAASETEAAAAATNTAAKSGEAIASATASGAKLPFPLNLAAIAAGIAAVISALSVIGSFADGGIVGGNSYVGDNLIARVNSGEMILNGKQQKHLFDLLDKGSSGNGVNGGNVHFVIRGKDLHGVLNNYDDKMKKVR